MRSRAKSATLVSAGAGSIAAGRAWPVEATIGCSVSVDCKPVRRLMPPWIVRHGSPRVQATAPRTYKHTASCQLIQSRMRPVESRDRTRVLWMSPEAFTSESMLTSELTSNPGQASGLFGAALGGAAGETGFPAAGARSIDQKLYGWKIGSADGLGHAHELDAIAVPLVERAGAFVGREH